MSQLPITFTQAITRAEIAADHADREEDGWSDRAAAFALGYARQHDTFLAEDVVRASTVGEPPDRRTWGAVVRRLSSAGIIERVRYAIDGYGSPKAVWRLKEVS